MIFTVLGGRGFIGRNLAEHLRAQGYEVLTPEPTALEAGKNYGHVMYCIGLTADFRQRPFDTMRAHVGLLEETLRSIKFESFVYLSSTRLYSAADSTCEDAAIRVDPHNPSDLYNISKLAGESLCLNSGLENVRIARISNVAGYDPHSDNLLSSLIRDGFSGQINLQASPDSAKDFIEIKQVVHVLEQIALRGKSGIYNVASGINTRYGALAEEIAKLTGSVLSLNPAGELQLFPVLSTDRIRNEFSFIPQDIVLHLPLLVESYKTGDPA